MIEYADPDDGRDHHGWRVNSQGRRWISNPAGKGRDLLYDGASSWPFDDYAGIDPIYAQRGQWVHTLTEIIDGGQFAPVDLGQRGVELGIPVDVQNEIADGYRAFREAHGLTAVHIEVKCVNDEHRVAGTIDRIDRTADGRHVIADIKTGGDVVKVATAVQLALYAGAVPYDIDTETRGEWGFDIDPLDAFVYGYRLTARLKGEPVAWECHPVDLRPGAALAGLLTALRYDRTHKDAFGQPIAAPTPPPVVEQPATDDASHGPAASSVATPTLEELRAEATEIGRHDPEFTPRLLAYFERNDVDKSDPMQVSEAISAVVNFRDVEATDTQPRPQVSPVIHPIPRAINEGPDVDADTVAAAGKRYAGLDDAARSWVSLCAAKVRLSPEHGGVASTRRLELLRGLCQLGESDGFDTDDMVRAIAALVGLGDAAWQTRRIADVVAALTLEEAVAFAKVADVVTTGDVAIRWELDGRCVLSTSVLAEVTA